MRLSIVCLFTILSLAFVSFGPRAYADDVSTFYIGHNMTPSTDTLQDHQWTIGTYAVAYGLSENAFVATSPWIWASYNTANIHAKWVPWDDGTTRFGLFGSYFHSYNSRPLDGGISGSSSICRDGGCHTLPAPVSSPNGGVPPGVTPSIGLSRYQWQSGSLHALASAEWTSNIESYFSLKYSYFWNDDLPYSIRMDPGSDAIRGQVDFTGLTEIGLPDPRFRLGLEAGGLGLNYLYPYLHVGASMSFLSPSWLIQFGASYTIQFREADRSSGWTPGRFDTRVHRSQSDGEYYFYRYLQTALHPEIQIQYFF